MESPPSFMLCIHTSTDPVSSSKMHSESNFSHPSSAPTLAHGTITPLLESCNSFLRGSSAFVLFIDTAIRGILIKLSDHITFLHVSK